MDDSHTFLSMSIGRTIPEIKLLQILTLKFQFQGQGHGCGQRARSYNRPILTHFIFISQQSDQQFPRAISKLDLETSKVKVMSEVKGQCHILHTASNRCTSFYSFTSIGPTIPDIWPKVGLTLKKHIRFFKRKFAKIKVSNRTSPKYNQVITITRAIKLPCFVVIWWVVLTLSRRKANFW